MLVLSPMLTEMGIKSFWDMIDIAKKESLSIWDWVMQMPPVGRVRCVEALMAEIKATPPLESLRHSVNMQETADIMAEYRRILEGVLRKLMLQVWQSCARQLRVRQALMQAQPGAWTRRSRTTATCCTQSALWS